MSKNYKAVITGDIVNSREVNSNRWMTPLKKVFNSIGNEPISWEIFRGDSFQLIVEPNDALRVALIIKSTIKQFKELDVRMAIGVGEVDYQADKITESNGTAFVNSGECFDSMKKETLKFKSPWIKFDLTMNVMLALGRLTMDNWTPASSEIIQLALQNPDLKQMEMAQKLDKPQSNISVGLKRGGFDEIEQLLNYYRTEINKLC